MLFRICIACDHTNPPDSRFCGQCGAPLHVRFCRLCRSANDAASRYCQSCGTELPELIAPEVAPPEAAAPGTIAPLVMATPGRPVAGATAMPPSSTTIAAASGGGQAQGKAGAPPPEGPGARPADGSDTQSAIEVLPPPPARAAPILVDGAVRAVNLPAVVGDGPPARAWRARSRVWIVAVVVIVGALAALAYNVWQLGAADPPQDRAAAAPTAPAAAPAPPAAAAVAAEPTRAPQPAAKSVTPPPPASASETATRK